MEKDNNHLFSSIKEIIIASRSRTYRMVNAVLIETYWQVGKTIVEEEQEGNAKAAYGNATLKTLATQLTLEFGNGFDYTNLTNMRKFFLAFPIFDALRQELSRTHYRLHSRIESFEKRNYYLNEAVQSNLNSRQLQASTYCICQKKRN